MYSIDNLIVDRGILSTLIYSKDKTDVVMEKIAPLMKQHNDEVWVISHKSKDVAQLKFNNRKLENRGFDPHSNFEDFESYWEQYLEYDKIQKTKIDMLKEIGITIKYLEV